MNMGSGRPSPNICSNLRYDKLVTPLCYAESMIKVIDESKPSHTQLLFDSARNVFIVRGFDWDYSTLWELTFASEDEAWHAFIYA